MAKGLSQKDIDALFSKVQSESESDNNHEISAQKTVYPYNFRSKKKIDQSCFAIIESIHKKFLRNFEVTLTNLLNKPVIASVAAATELSYSEYTDSISPPTCLYLLNLRPVSGRFLVELDPNFAFFVIDKVLGGSGTVDATLRRELSIIEERIMYRVINMLLHDLKDAWKMVINLEFEVEGYYSQSDYIQALRGGERILLISMEIRGGETIIGFLNLCLPIGILDPLLWKYKEREKTVALKRSEKEITNDRKIISQQITKSIVPLRVVLGETAISVSDLLKMEIGDILCLKSEANKPLEIFLGNLKMYQGMLFNKENFLAVRISATVKNANGKRGHGTDATPTT
ncbi:MAG: flagellar motor switch protein FliM [bacterium]